MGVMQYKRNTYIVGLRVVTFNILQQSYRTRDVGHQPGSAVT